MKLGKANDDHNKSLPKKEFKSDAASRVYTKLSQLGSQQQGPHKVEGPSITCSDQMVMLQADKQLWRDKTCPALMSWKALLLLLLL